MRKSNDFDEVEVVGDLQSGNHKIYKLLTRDEVAGKILSFVVLTSLT